MTVLKERLKYKLDLVGVQYRRSDWMEVALNQQAIRHFCMEREMRIMD
jgi:hypothetical protein